MQPPRLRAWLALLALALAAPLAWLALGYAGALSPGFAPAGDGDVVVFHATARDADGVVRYTTDSDVARREIAAGNPFLAPVEEGYPYVARRYVVAPGTGNESELATHLAGARAGDRRETPRLPDPFGPAPVVTVRRVHGGFDLREIRAELGLDVGARAYAAALDANVSVVAGDEPGRVALAIDVMPGERIHPKACRLPIGLPSANLTVLRVTADEIAFTRDADARRHAYGHDLSIELSIVQVLQAHDPRVALPILRE